MIEKKILAVLGNLIRIGRVSSINDQNGTVQVVFEDKDDIVTEELPLMAFDYYIPEPKDLVLCVFLPNGLTTGFCLWRYYNEENMPLIQDKDIYYKEFFKQAMMKYNRNDKTLSIMPWGDAGLEIIELLTDHIKLIAQKTIELTAQETITCTAQELIRLVSEDEINQEATTKIVLTSPNIFLNGNLTLGGPEGTGTGSIRSSFNDKEEIATETIISHAGGLQTISSELALLISAPLIDINGASVNINGVAH